MDFLSYVEKNYLHIKSLLSQYKDFDEDIFHNTIIKCCDIMSDHDFQFTNDNEILRYFIGAYKTNVLREKLYYYNKNSVNGLDISLYDQPNGEQLEILVDIQLIYDIILKKFGVQLAEAFKLYISEGISIEKLLERTGIKNVKLKIKIIKEYILKLKNDLVK